MNSHVDIEELKGLYDRPIIESGDVIFSNGRDGERVPILEERKLNSNKDGITITARNNSWDVLVMLT